MNSGDVYSFTTLPRRSSRSVQEQIDMDLERKLASLNIAPSSKEPVPPPRYKRMQRKLSTLPNKSSVDSANMDKYRPEKYNFDKDFTPDEFSTCDIIRSSSVRRNKSSNEPDILKHGQAAIDSREPEPKPKSKSLILRGRNTSHSSSSSTSSRESLKSHQFSNKETVELSDVKYDTANHKHHKNSKKLPATSPIKESTPTKMRFSFYRPKSIKERPSQPPKYERPDAKSQTNNTGSSFPHGAFDNPAFNVVDPPQYDGQSPLISPPKRGGSIQQRRAMVSTPLTINTDLPTTKNKMASRIPLSPPSTRFKPRLQKQSEVSDNFPPNKPMKSLLPTKALPPKGQPIRPVPAKTVPGYPLSTKYVEAGLQKYTTKLDPGDTCSPTDLESMMRYYQLPSSSQKEESAPSPGKMKSKIGSPYSSTSSLNISGDDLETIHRRKKKIKIRPPSFSSDDETVKRISLEINLIASTEPTKPTHKLITSSTGSKEEGAVGSENPSDNKADVEKISLDDLTSTETANILKKQFSKLKMRASSLKVKDTELKQRFMILQNKRGRLNSSSGGIHKARSRTSLTSLV